MPGTVLGTNVITINKTDKFPAVLEHTLQCGKAMYIRMVISDSNKCCEKNKTW